MRAGPSSSRSGPQQGSEIPMSELSAPADGRAPDAIVRRREAHTIGFLGVPDLTPEGQRIFDENLAEVGYVMNASRLWAYQPATMTGLFTLLRRANSADSLSLVDASF